MTSFSDIFEGTSETASLDIGSEISECLLSMLSAAALTALNNAMSSMLDGFSAELLGLDDQIFQLEEQSLAFDIGDPLGDAVQSLANITQGIGNPFAMDTVEIPCLGSIPMIPSLGAFSLSNPFGSLAMIIIALIKIAILTALRAALMALLIKLLADQKNITKTLQGRANGSLPEPLIDWTNPELTAYADTLAPGDLAQIERHREYVQNNIVTPYKQNTAGIAAYEAQFAAQDKMRGDVGDGDGEKSPFDIVFGPPISTDGKFILSNDGLYYDSRSGGVPNVVAQEILASNWKLKYNPNKGGKGILLGDGRLKSYSNTVFSHEFQETNDMVDYFFKNDDILQAFESDKAIHTNEVSGQITELVASGYARSSALVQNYYRSVAAISRDYDTKISKRKKQLQMAGLFGTYTLTSKNFPLGAGYILDSSGVKPFDDNFPSGWTINPDNTVYFNTGGEAQGILVSKLLERIPLNDFGYLKGSGLVPDLQFQKEALIQSADVSGIILPVQPRFVTAPQGNSVYIRDFNVSPEAPTDFPHIEASAANYGDIKSQKPFIKALDDGIVTNSLITCYNFLQADVVAPSSLNYNLDNKASSYTSLNGKLVGRTAQDVFPSGLSIPYLRGTSYNPGGQFFPEPWYATSPKGSYVRLKNNIKNGEFDSQTQKLDNLAYSDSGFNVSFWSHIPDVWSGLRRWHRYRVIFGCENSGPGGAGNGREAVTANPNLVDATGEVTRDRDPSKVHGLFIGWRDKGNTATDSVASDTNSSNLEFVILPTVSQNKLSGEFAHSVAIAGIPSNPYSPTTEMRELGVKIPSNVFTSQDTYDKRSPVTPIAVGDSLSGVSISSIENSFVNVSLSFDYPNDAIQVYLDGKILVTSSISESFYLNAAQPLNVPSFVNLGDGYENSLGVRTSISRENNFTESLHEGSLLAPNLPMQTPWIIGGGFTDIATRSYDMETDVGFRTTPFGFLGSNTNDKYFTKVADVSSGGIVGQHVPGLGGEAYTGVVRNIPRSGLDGYVGSFKLYSRPLNTTEVLTNFVAQRGYFQNINIT